MPSRDHQVFESDRVVILVTYKVLDRLLLYMMVYCAIKVVQRHDCIKSRTCLLICIRKQNKKQIKEMNIAGQRVYSIVFYSDLFFSDTGKWLSSAISRKEKTVLIDVSFD